jgi:putative restriction endonuclease
MHDFDRPLFKRLAHNDTGSAAGHQGGIVIPKDMDRYFPQLSRAATAGYPTVDKQIRAVLFVGNIQVGLIETRYQYQTWGGARSPERRLTGSLGPLRNAAAAEDFLLIERSLSDPEFYRLTLHKSGTAAYAALVAKTTGRRWGPVDIRDVPVPETEIEVSMTEQEAHETAPLDLFDNTAALQETRTKRIARSQAFSRRVLPIYEFRCAVCGHAHAADNGSTEAEAAHIVPRGLKGADDARNGMALCRSHHWAFDRGLFGVRPDRRIVLRPAAAAELRNAHLLPLAGSPIREPTVAGLRPAANALAWHLSNVVGL